MVFKPTVHSAFTLERMFDVPPALVFEAWSTPEGKKKWFVAHEAKEHLREMDFRVGGKDALIGEWPNGMKSEFRAQYVDIKPNERIVYVYEMWLDVGKIAKSLSTIDFEPTGKGTRLVLTEHQLTELVGAVPVREALQAPGGPDRAGAGPHQVSGERGGGNAHETCS